VEEPGGGTSGGAANGTNTETSADSGSGSEENDGGLQPTPLDAGRDARPPNDPSCPQTYSAPRGTCTVGTTCEYDEGICRCAARCGGASVPRDEATGQWRCMPRPDPRCPAQPPPAGGPCKGTIHCRYGDCCPQLYECINDKWSVGGTVCPPGLPDR